MELFLREYIAKSMRTHIYTDAQRSNKHNNYSNIEYYININDSSQQLQDLYNDSIGFVLDASIFDSQTTTTATAVSTQTTIITDSTLYEYLNFTCDGESMSEASMNATSIDDVEDEEGALSSVYFKTAVYLLYIPIFIFALLGNGTVCYIVQSTPRMRTVTNFFIANLAVGDILMSLFCVPFSFVSIFILGYWPFGIALCYLVNYSQAVSVLVSAYTLVAISVDRYIAIMWPLRPRITKRYAKFIIAGVWAIALATAFPIPIVSKLTQPGPWHVKCHRYICQEEWPSNEQNYYYTLALFTLQFVIPLAVLIFTYTRIALAVWGKRPPGEAENSRDQRMARSKRKLADDVEPRFPLASNILRNHMYVDDALAGGHDIESTVQARIELEKAAESTGFLLRKWTSNSDDVLQGIPKGHRLREDFLQLEDTSNVKTLGIRWNARSDYFYFHARPLDQTGSFSKREVLSAIAKLFDPAGWLAPVVIIAKILMQQVWLDGIGWDDQLIPTTLQRWQSFLKNYSHISSVQIPRWVHFSPEGDVQFHGFCDASEKAYGAAVYIRVKILDQVSVHLLVAKTKVAPVKTVSLPRLELCGALLLAEMVEAFLSNLETFNKELFLWTDSTIVLAWLRKQPCTWTTFVANRVAKISEKVGTENWSHVESADNPADLASRGLEPQNLKESSLWWHGPGWLQQEPNIWPHSRDEYDTTLEAKPLKVHVACAQTLDILDRFSALPRALRVLSYVLRFFHRTHLAHKNNFCYQTVEISQHEIKEATKRLVIESQKLGYLSEYTQLTSKTLIDSKSSILNLNPFLDNDKVLRVGGRLSETEHISYDERHPVILPYDCQFSRLLVKFTHEISIHGGNQLVLRLIRMQYWIPRVKNMIKSIIHNCKVCVIDRKRLQTQMMASLPPERTKLSRPFASTGVDFTGPYDIKNYTGRACLITKGYICVFVCFATKAIHLEATSDLSTVTFLAAFSRFVSRRGCPEKMYSDNGTNFVGASRAFKEDFKAFLNASKEKVVSKFAHQHLTWHFIPAGAPHMGGLWEAGVKSFKLHFRKVASDMKYTFEELSTLLSRIEACLNSRPLSPASSDPNDLAPLTPAHFLVGGPLLAPIEPDIVESPMSIINRWQKLKALNQRFCQMWKNDYLKELHKRYKWKNPREDLKIDDLVVIKADNLAATEWRLGRVVKIYVGSDNRVRVADLRTERGIVTRPVVKLITLPPTS